MDEEDEMILNETIKKAQEDEIVEHEEEKSDKTDEKNEEYEENADFLAEMASPTQFGYKVEEETLKKIIEKSFHDIKTAKKGMAHPKKPDVYCEKTYDIFPNFDDINLE